MITPNLNVFLMPEDRSDNRSPRVVEDRSLPLLPFLLQLLSGKRRNLTMTQIIKKGKCQKFFFSQKWSSFLTLKYLGSAVSIVEGLRRSFCHNFLTLHFTTLFSDLLIFVTVFLMGGKFLGLKMTHHNFDFYIVSFTSCKYPFHQYLFQMHDPDVLIYLK